MSGDDTRDDSAAFQAAIAAADALGGEVIHVPGAKGYRLNGGLALGGRNGIGFDFHKSAINFHGAGALFDIGADGAARANNPSFAGGRLVLWTPGATAFRIENAYAPQFRDIDINLRAARQVGFALKATRSPVGPYYGAMDNVTVYGSGQPGSGQTGYRFLGAGADGADGINRWVFNNLRHVAAVDLGIDVVGCAGLVFNNVNFEATYDTAIRFNDRKPDHSGRVTADSGNPSILVDRSFRSTYDTASAVVVVISGRNAGRSKNVAVASDGRIVFGDRFPWPFQPGDRYALYYAKAINCHVTNATCETAGTVADFRAGARGCRVELAFCTIDAASYYFRRGAEDMSNSIARDHLVYSFEGSLPAGGGDIWLSPQPGAANQGGVTVPPNGTMWIDALTVSGASRAVGSPGTIRVTPYASGVPLGADMTAVLTEASPFNDARVRRSLQPAGCLRAGDNIKIRVAADAALATRESVRVEVYVGVL